MASLTGNKIKDTYTSLLKVGDNGTIDSSAQALTDGAGNALGLTLTNTGVLVSTAKGTLVGTSSTGEVSSAMVADNAITATQLNISGNGTSGQLIQSDGDGSFSYVAASTGDITGVTAGDGLSGGGTSGAVSLALASSSAGDGLSYSSGVLAVGVDDSTVEINSDALRLKDSGVVTAKIADDNVTFAKLENRYTAKVDITTYTGAVSIDWSAGTTFKMGSSLTCAIEFDFTNFKQGQVITFYNLTGSQTITLDSDAGTSETFNKVGGVDYDGSTTNMIHVECIDDSANAIFNYVVATYTSDTTPS